MGLAASIAFADPPRAPGALGGVSEASRVQAIRFLMLAANLTGEIERAIREHPAR